MRYWEAVVAHSHGIPFDNSWYNIPLATREMMVGQHMASVYIADLSASGMEKHNV